MPVRNHGWPEATPDHRLSRNGLAPSEGGLQVFLRLPHILGSSGAATSPNTSACLLVHPFESPSQAAKRPLANGISRLGFNSPSIAQRSGPLISSKPMPDASKALPRDWASAAPNVPKPIPKAILVSASWLNFLTTARSRRPVRSACAGSTSTNCQPSPRNRSSRGLAGSVQ